MVQVPDGFDPKKEAEGHRAGVDIIEPGWKKVVIVDSGMKDTKAGTGKLLEFKNELQDGSGRTFIDRLNIRNNNEIAQKIGRGALAKIALAVGIKGELKNTDVLHGRAYMVKLEVEEYDAKDADGNIVKGEDGKPKQNKSNKVKDYKAVGAEDSAPEGSTPTEGSSEKKAW